MFQAKKGSKNAHLKGRDEFLQAELEVDPTGAAGHGEKPSQGVVMHTQSQSIRLAQVRRRHDENLWLKSLPRELPHWM